MDDSCSNIEREFMEPRGWLWVMGNLARGSASQPAPPRPKLARVQEVQEITKVMGCLVQDAEAAQARLSLRILGLTRVIEKGVPVGWNRSGPCRKVYPGDGDCQTLVKDCINSRLPSSPMGKIHLQCVLGDIQFYPSTEIQVTVEQYTMSLMIGVAASQAYLLVPKPDRTTRVSIDFRRVNAISKFEAYPMPLIRKLLDRLGETEYITTLDLTKGYSCKFHSLWNSKEKTAFSTTYILYQFQKILFGQHGALAIFQRLMDRILKPSEVML